MSKLIFKTPSFDLMKDVKKKFGVEFHPNSTVSSVENFLKERDDAEQCKSTQKEQTILSDCRSDQKEEKGVV
tara:strand:+ start:332 stop:547 length:216 start_codon:yes stop_codon:yes gene_type:complete